MSCVKRCYIPRDKGATYLETMKRRSKSLARMTPRCKSSRQKQRGNTEDGLACLPASIVAERWKHCEEAERRVTRHCPQEPQSHYAASRHAQKHKQRAFSKGLCVFHTSPPARAKKSKHARQAGVQQRHRKYSYKQLQAALPPLRTRPSCAHALDRSLANVARSKMLLTAQRCS